MASETPSTGRVHCCGSTWRRDGWGGRRSGDFLSTDVRVARGEGGGALRAPDGALAVEAAFGGEEAFHETLSSRADRPAPYSEGRSPDAPHQGAPCATALPPRAARLPTNQKSPR